ncbi:hypothetical protein ACTSKR_11195 [Chitinibacteraceae bacterium HSL-7]
MTRHRTTTSAASPASALPTNPNPINWTIPTLKEKLALLFLAALCLALGAGLLFLFSVFSWNYMGKSIDTTGFIVLMCLFAFAAFFLYCGARLAMPRWHGRPLFGELFLRWLAYAFAALSGLFLLLFVINQNAALLKGGVAAGSLFAMAMMGAKTRRKAESQAG